MAGYSNNMFHQLRFSGAGPIMPAPHGQETYRFDQPRRYSEDGLQIKSSSNFAPPQRSVLSVNPVSLPTNPSNAARGPFFVIRDQVPNDYAHVILPEDDPPFWLTFTQLFIASVDDPGTYIPVLLWWLRDTNIPAMLELMFHVIQKRDEIHLEKEVNKVFPMAGSSTQTGPAVSTNKHNPHQVDVPDGVFLGNVDADQTSWFRHFYPHYGGGTIPVQGVKAWEEATQQNLIGYERLVRVVEAMPADVVPDLPPNVDVNLQVYVNSSSEDRHLINQTSPLIENPFIFQPSDAYTPVFVNKTEPKPIERGDTYKSSVGEDYGSVTVSNDDPVSGQTQPMMGEDSPMMDVDLEEPEPLAVAALEHAKVQYAPPVSSAKNDQQWVDFLAANTSSWKDKVPDNIKSYAKGVPLQPIADLRTNMELLAEAGDVITNFTKGTVIGLAAANYPLVNAALGNLYNVPWSALKASFNAVLEGAEWGVRSSVGLGSRLTSRLINQLYKGGEFIANERTMRRISNAGYYAKRGGKLLANISMFGSAAAVLAWIMKTSYSKFASWSPWLMERFWNRPEAQPGKRQVENLYQALQFTEGSESFAEFENRTNDLYARLRDGDANLKFLRGNSSGEIEPIIAPDPDEMLYLIMRDEGLPVFTITPALRMRMKAWPQPVKLTNGQIMRDIAMELKSYVDNASEVDLFKHFVENPQKFPALFQYFAAMKPLMSLGYTTSEITTQELQSRITLQLLSDFSPMLKQAASTNPKEIQSNYGSVILRIQATPDEYFLHTLAYHHLELCSTAALSTLIQTNDIEGFQIVSRGGDGQILAAQIFGLTHDTVLTNIVTLKTMAARSLAYFAYDPFGIPHMGYGRMQPAAFISIPRNMPLPDVNAYSSQGLSQTFNNAILVGLHGNVPGMDMFYDKRGHTEQFTFSILDHLYKADVSGIKYPVEDINKMYYDMSEFWSFQNPSIYDAQLHGITSYKFKDMDLVAEYANAEDLDSATTILSSSQAFESRTLNNDQLMNFPFLPMVHFIEEHFDHALKNTDSDADLQVETSTHIINLGATRIKKISRMMRNPAYQHFHGLMNLEILNVHWSYPYEIYKLGVKEPMVPVDLISRSEAFQTWVRIIAKNEIVIDGVVTPVNAEMLRRLSNNAVPEYNFDAFQLRALRAFKPGKVYSYTIGAPSTSPAAVNIEGKAYVNGNLIQVYIAYLHARYAGYTFMDSGDFSKGLMIVDPDTRTAYDNVKDLLSVYGGVTIATHMIDALCSATLPAATEVLKSVIS